jgi:hypothetical protein
MQIYTNPKGIFESLLAIGPDYLLIANPKESELAAAEEALQQGASHAPKDAKVIPFAAIKRIRYNTKSPGDLEISYKAGNGLKSARFGFSSEADLITAFDELKQSVPGMLEKREKLNAVTAAIKPIIFTVIFAALTYVLFRGAQGLSEGGDADTSGRYGLVKKIFAWLLELLGPTGVLVVGGILVILCVVVLIKRVGNPPEFVSLEAK